MAINIKNILNNLKKGISSLSDNDEKFEQLQNLHRAITMYEGDDMLVSSKEIADRIRNRPEEEKFMSGYSDLDDIIGGFRKKQLVVISAATKSGKTSFCIDMTAHMQDANPVWLPLEESAEELVQKFLDRKEEPPHFYAPQKVPQSPLDWVETKIIEATIKFKTKVVFIDHLHFIVPATHDRYDLAIGLAMRELKRIAREWDVLIFLIVHIKKARMDTPPSIEELRDSSFIAQESDMVIMLFRLTKRVNGHIVIGNEVNVSVQTNRRNGNTGNVRMMFNGGKFIQMAKGTEGVTEEKSWNE